MNTFSSESPNRAAVKIPIPSRVLTNTELDDVSCFPITAARFFDSTILNYTIQQAINAKAEIKRREQLRRRKRKRRMRYMPIAVAIISIVLSIVSLVLHFQ